MDESWDAEVWLHSRFPNFCDRISPALLPTAICIASSAHNEAAAGRAASGGQQVKGEDAWLDEIEQAWLETTQIKRRNVYRTILRAFAANLKRELEVAPAAAPELNWEQVQELRRIFNDAPGGRANRQSLINDVNTLLRKAGGK